MEHMVKFEEIKTLISKVIDNEYYNVQEVKEEEFNKIEEYKKLNERNEEIWQKINEVIPAEYKRLFIEYSDNQTEIMWQYQGRYWFKEGVRKGITNLNFLGEDILIKNVVNNL